MMGAGPRYERYLEGGEHAHMGQMSECLHSIYNQCQERTLCDYPEGAACLSDKACEDRVAARQCISLSCDNIKLNPMTFASKGPWYSSNAPDVLILRWLHADWIKNARAI